LQGGEKREGRGGRLGRNKKILGRWKIREEKEGDLQRLGGRKRTDGAAERGRNELKKKHSSETLKKRRKGFGGPEHESPAKEGEGRAKKGRWLGKKVTRGAIEQSCGNDSHKQGVWARKGGATKERGREKRGKGKVQKGGSG